MKGGENGDESGGGTGGWKWAGSGSGGGVSVAKTTLRSATAEIVGSYAAGEDWELGGLWKWRKEGEARSTEFSNRENGEYTEQKEKKSFLG